MKTKKIRESAEWVLAYTIDYVGKIVIGSSAALLCFLPLLLR